MNKGIAHVQVQQAQDRFRTHMQVAAQVRWFSAAPCLVPESSTSTWSCHGTTAFHSLICIGFHPTASEEDG